MDIHMHLEIYLKNAFTTSEFIQSIHFAGGKYSQVTVNYWDPTGFSNTEMNIGACFCVAALNLLDYTSSES